MSKRPAEPLRFVGVLGTELGCEPNIGEIVTIEYAGGVYKARVTSRYDDYDDFGTAMTRYDLEVPDEGMS
jgi:hypothetical protein